MQLPFVSRNELDKSVAEGAELPEAQGGVIFTLPAWTISQVRKARAFGQRMLVQEDELQREVDQLNG